jgi:plastocyanin
MDAWFKMAVVAILGVAVLVGVTVGKSQSQSTAAAPPPPSTSLPAPLPGHVDILDSPGEPPASFDPLLLQIHAGSTVTWSNLSTSAQSVTADNSAFGSDVLSTGQSFTWQATKPGKYTYGSYINPDVRGEIDVTP